jgi:hypothetical protein
MKLLKYLLLNRVTKDPMTAAKVYQMIYHPELAPRQSVRSTNETSFEGTSQAVVVPKQPYKVTDKEYWMPQDEVQAGLDYLKNKTNKTTKDRQNIQMLEAILRNKANL